LAQAPPDQLLYRNAEMGLGMIRLGFGHGGIFGECLVIRAQGLQHMSEVDHGICMIGHDGKHALKMAG